jgi:hypothetical protein
MFRPPRRWLNLLVPLPLPIRDSVDGSWAAEAGGPRYGRLFGFLVAWWSSTAWTTFCASNSQASANYLLSEISVFNLPFTTNVDDIDFRAVQWIVAELFMALAVVMTWLPPRWYRYVFMLGTGVICLDFLLNIIWLPIGVAQSYGFQSASFVFTGTANLTGASPVWNWYQPRPLSPRLGRC